MVNLDGYFRLAFDDVEVGHQETVLIEDETGPQPAGRRTWTTASPIWLTKSSTLCAGNGLADTEYRPALTSGAGCGSACGSGAGLAVAAAEAPGSEPQV